MIHLKNLLQRIKRKVLIDIPGELLSDFQQDVLEDNFSRLSVIAVVVFIIEVPLMLTDEHEIHRHIMFCFLMTSLVLIPLIFYIKKNIKRMHQVFVLAVMYAYSLSALLFGAAMALGVMPEMDATHFYMMAVLAIALFLYFRPIPLAILYAAAYALFACLLPYAGAQPESLTTIRVNALMFNLFAWLFSHLALKSRACTYMNRRLLHDQNQKLEDLAQRDTMTGLFNHSVSFERLKDEIKRAKTKGYPLSLIIADIDDFKQVNDNHGHLVGDLVIRKIANAIRGAVRDNGIVGRYGGEEFIVILPRTDIDAARALSTRIQAAIAQAEQHTPVTLSGGISQYAGESLNEFIRLTDEKLYKAKRRGKNRFRAD